MSDIAGSRPRDFGAGQRCQGFHVYEYTITLAALPRAKLARCKIQVILFPPWGGYTP